MDQSFHESGWLRLLQVAWLTDSFHRLTGICSKGFLVSLKIEKLLEIRTLEIILCRYLFIERFSSSTHETKEKLSKLN
jgi:hypothetical protein